jgi:hypothetical protein
VPFGRWGRAPGTRSAVLDDIGTGIEEAPLQAFAGISDAIGNTLIAADELAGWLNTHVADLRFSTLFGMEGTDTPDKNSPEFQHFAEGFKALPQPKSVTGGLVRGSAAWLAGLSASARGLQALGAGATASTIAGSGISSFFTQAADDHGLSNLVQQYPVLANPVTEFLASTPGDNAALNRLKHSLEGLGLSALAEGIVRGLVLVQMARAAKGDGEETAAAVSNAADTVQPEPTTTPLGELGSPRTVFPVPTSAAQPNPQAASATVPGSQAAEAAAPQLDPHVAGLDVSAVPEGHLSPHPRLATSRDATSRSRRPSDVRNGQVEIRLRRSRYNDDSCRTSNKMSPT